MAFSDFPLSSGHRISTSEPRPIEPPLHPTQNHHNPTSISSPEHQRRGSRLLPPRVSCLTRLQPIDPASSGPETQLLKPRIYSKPNLRKKCQTRRLGASSHSFTVKPWHPTHRLVTSQQLAHNLIIALISSPHIKLINLRQTPRIKLDIRPIRTCLLPSITRAHSHRLMCRAI